MVVMATTTTTRKHSQFSSSGHVKDEQQEHEPGARLPLRENSDLPSSSLHPDLVPREDLRLLPSGGDSDVAFLDRGALRPVRLAAQLEQTRGKQHRRNSFLDFDEGEELSAQGSNTRRLSLVEERSVEEEGSVPASQVQKHTEPQGMGARTFLAPREDTQVQEDLSDERSSYLRDLMSKRAIMQTDKRAPAPPPLRVFRTSHLPPNNCPESDTPNNKLSTAREHGGMPVIRSSGRSSRRSSAIPCSASFSPSEPPTCPLPPLPTTPLPTTTLQTTSSVPSFAHSPDALVASASLSPFTCPVSAKRRRSCASVSSKRASVASRVGLGIAVPPQKALPRLPLPPSPVSPPKHKDAIDASAATTMRDPYIATQYVSSEPSPPSTAASRSVACDYPSPPPTAKSLTLSVKTVASNRSSTSLAMFDDIVEIAKEADGGIAPDAAERERGASMAETIRYQLNNSGAGEDEGEGEVTELVQMYEGDVGGESDEEFELAWRKSRMSVPLRTLSHSPSLNELHRLRDFTKARARQVVGKSSVSRL